MPADHTMSGFIRHLRQVMLRRERTGMTDGQLLTCFIERRDEAAFEELVRLHGPMVLGVCRRVLGDTPDVEDAFQATFLVLVRKAASLTRREGVANWLYGVAFRTARQAKVRLGRRFAREKQVKDMPEKIQPEPVEQDWELLLDEELNRLPEKYRQPIVLCDLESRSRKEVAQQLQIPEGTLSSRLATARRMLRKRLAGRGLVLTGSGLGAALTQSAASASVPLPLVASTVKAATFVAASQTIAGGMISAKIASLTDGVLKAMLLAKIKNGVVVLLVAAVLGSGTSMVAYRTMALATERIVIEEERKPSLQTTDNFKPPEQVEDRQKEKEDRTAETVDEKEIRRTIEAFLTSALAGRVKEARALTRPGKISEEQVKGLRNLGMKKPRLVKLRLGSTDASAVTEKATVSDVDGQREGHLLLTLDKKENRWVLSGMEFQKSDFDAARTR